ncbi:MAG: glucose-1-phosphate thymidylyltransferase RfbA [Thermodesulfobacteriota bacterium]
MKGILLAGGTGSRLYPATRACSKQLLPVYDKPMVYYPLTVLMMAGIREILVITTPRDRSLFERLLSDGSHLGISLRYAVQDRPGGIAQAFLIAGDFLERSPVCLVLGDTFLHGPGLREMLSRAAELLRGGLIFGYEVKDPERYGVLSLDAGGRVTAITEKPSRPASSFAVPGLYFYDHTVRSIAEGLVPSGRGELEITDINRAYLDRGELSAELLGSGYTWLDMGTFEDLAQASSFVRTVQDRRGGMIGCPEEIAARLGYIGKKDLIRLAEAQAQSSYGRCLMRLADGFGKDDA